MRAAERALASSLAYAAVSALLLLAQVVLAGLLILALRLFCSGDGCPGALLLDSAAFAFISAATALSQYYLASLFRHSQRSRALTLVTVLTALLVSLFIFAPLAVRSRFEAYWLAWLPLAASFLIGALPAVFEKEADNPWRDSSTDLFRL